MDKHGKRHLLKPWQWLVIFLFLSTAAFFLYLPNYSKLKKLKEENNRLLAGIDSLKKEIDTIKGDVEKLERDPFVFEQLVREELDVVKDGEIVVDIRKQGE
ncbi:MAG: septum formation initiator family protein [Candidatus Omnitrophota bacterium]